MTKLRAIHYINQFYSGYGGEAKADMELVVLDGAKGPGVGLNGLWDDKMEIIQTLACGDNYVNDDENFNIVKEKIKEEILKHKPDVFIAGPAFNAGRYGVACAKVCDYVQNVLGVPSVTAMWHENPAISIYVRDIYILPTTEIAGGMKEILPRLAGFSLKLANNEKIEASRKDGYFPKGYRYNEYHEKTGAVRVVQMLIKKLNNKPFNTEVPLRGLEMIEPAKELKDVSAAKVALITTGGLVPIGNPDKLKQAFSVSYGRYNIKDIDKLSNKDFESIHGGYDTTFASADPHRLIPLDQVRKLEEEGKFDSIYDYFFTTCGVGTNVESSKKMGSEIAKELVDVGVTAAILTTT